MDKGFAQKEVRERVLNAYNDGRRSLTIDELYSELTSDLNVKHSQPKRSDVEKVLKEMKAAGLLCYRGASTYDFTCNYADLINYITALTQPIKKRSAYDVISNEDLLQSTWVLDMSTEAKEIALPDNDESEDIDIDLDLELEEIQNLLSDDDDDEEEADEDDEIEDTKLKELEALLEGKKIDKTALFYEARKRVVGWAKNRPNYDSKSLSFTTNFRVSFAPDSPFKIRVFADERTHQIYLTDCGTAFQAVSSLVDAIQHPTLLTSEKLIHKVSADDNYSLCVCENNEVGLLCDAENESQFELCVLTLIRNVSWFVSEKLAWLAPSQDKDAKIDAFFNKTKENRYEYNGRKSSQKIVIALIEKIILVDYYMKREDAIQLSNRLKSHIDKQNNATKTTKDIFERLYMEFYLASDTQYMELRDQLFLGSLSPNPR